MSHDPMARDKRVSEAQGFTREGRPEGRPEGGERPDRAERGPRGRRNKEDKE
jgi:hypothetical protein